MSSAAVTMANPSPKTAKKTAEGLHKRTLHRFRLTRLQKLYAVTVISTIFSIVEIVIGFRQGSLVLIADAFHVTSDLFGFIIAIVAVHLSESDKPRPTAFSYGFQRAPILGAFFNGAFLAGLGLSVALTSIERLISPVEVKDPKIILIVGAVGLALNILSALIVHEHGHDEHRFTAKMDAVADRRDEETLQASAILSLSSRPNEHALHIHTLRPMRPKAGMDYNLLGVLLHLLGDAINNVAVIVASVVLWQTGFTRADAIAALFVGISIIVTAWPLIKNAGRLLLEAAPKELDLKDLAVDIKSLPGVMDIHEMHVFSLTQTKHIASLHVTVAADTQLREFVSLAGTIRQCMHAWGLHGGVTVQPELAAASAGTAVPIANNEAQGSSSAVADISDADQHLMHVNLQKACSMPCVQDCPASSCCD